MSKRIGEYARKARSALLVAALTAAGAQFAYQGAFAEDNKPAEKNPPVRLHVDEQPVNRDGKFTTSFSPVVKKVSPSVVKVFTTTKPKQIPGRRGMSPFDDPMFRRFFGDQMPQGGFQPRMERQHGLGSGVIATEDGYILTNNHVIEGADEIKVALDDGREFTAKVVGGDPKSDVAVLKVEAKGLPYVQVADSDKIEVGDVVLAVGNPFGVGQTVTMGMVSATGRASLGLDYEDFIQTDAAINPGNSGGALVDAHGRLIGINTAILSRTGGNNGIGFAIPSNLARMVMESIVENGRVVRGFLGVNIQDVDPKLAKEFELKEGTKGALVADVTAKSPAEKAGLKAGDIIVELDGKPVTDSRHLKLRVGAMAPGAEVAMKVSRDGKVKNLTATLKELPGDQQLARKSDKAAAGESDALNGVTVGDIDSETRAQFRIPREIAKGAVVTDVEQDSASYAAGLRPGDVILEINRKPINDAGEAVELSGKIDEVSSILLRVWSRGATRYVVVDETKVG